MASRAAPRFVFRHAKRKLVTWIELRGTSVAVASGPLGATPKPEVHGFPTEQAAIRERDRLVRELVTTGYELELTAAAPPPEAKPVRGNQLLSHPELETALAHDPDDAAAWMVYEDWLMSSGDPRAEIVEYERARVGSAARDATLVRQRLASLLLGKRADALFKRIMGATWRGGSLRSCRYEARGRDQAALFAAFAAAPATRLLTELELMVTDYELLAHVGALTQLRALRIKIDTQGYYTLDGAHLASLARLESVSAHWLSAVRYTPNLARLRSLFLQGTAQLDLLALFRNSFAGLRELTIIADREFSIDRWNLDQLAAAAPELASLTLNLEGPGAASPFVDQVAASPLRTQLATLRIYAFEPVRVLDVSERGVFHGGAFATVSRLELPRSVR